MAARCPAAAPAGANPRRPGRRRRAPGRRAARCPCCAGRPRSAGSWGGVCSFDIDGLLARPPRAHHAQEAVETCLEAGQLGRSEMLEMLPEDADAHLTEAVHDGAAVVR